MPMLTLTELDQPKLLIVDDEPSVRRLLCRWAEGAGYRSTEAGCTNSAWDALLSDNIQLVVTDIRMPGRNGISLLTRVKQFYQHIPVLLITGHSDTGSAVESLTSGAFGYLEKPVEREDFLVQVERGLRQRDAALRSERRLRALEAQVGESAALVRRTEDEVITRLLMASSVRDEETGAHIRRTGLYCQAFAEAIGWSTEQSKSLRLAGAMHDLGKIGVPDSVLRKPGPLTPSERLLMQYHTIIGAEMLQGSASPVLQLASEIALYHHERWDGTGYPHRRVGDAIPLSARIVALVDVYDALTHDRVYRPALEESEALILMFEGKDSHFDPDLFDMFLRILPVIRQISRENPDEPADAPKDPIPEPAVFATVG